jgi:hypothetical protein
MDKKQFTKWLSTPLKEDINNNYIDRLLELYEHMENSLDSKGIFLNDNSRINFMRFCYLLFRNSHSG